MKRQAITFDDKQSFGECCVRLKEAGVRFSLAGFRTVVIEGDPSADGIVVYQAMAAHAISGKGALHLRIMERGRGPTLTTPEEAERRLREFVERDQREAREASMSTTFEGIVRGLRSAPKLLVDVGSSGMEIEHAVGGQGGAAGRSRLEISDEALKEFHIGQHVRVTVEAVEEVV